MASSFFTYATSLGPVTLGVEDGALARVVLGAVRLSGTEGPSALSNRAANQIHEYLAGKRRVFDLPLGATGTAFQQACWATVARIPYGQTRTYADVAASAGHAGAGRAVGMACKANPLPLVVPCHRVVPATGGVGGYAYGPQLKEFLLNLEKSNA